jgi:hypothetical protein
MSLCLGSFKDLERPHDAGPVRCGNCGQMIETWPYSGYLRPSGWSLKWVECVRIAPHDPAPVGADP